MQFPAAHAPGSHARRSWRAGHKCICSATSAALPSAPGWPAAPGPGSLCSSAGASPGSCGSGGAEVSGRTGGLGWVCCGTQCPPQCTARISSKGHIGATAHNTSGFMPQVGSYTEQQQDTPRRPQGEATPTSSSAGHASRAWRRQARRVRRHSKRSRPGSRRAAPRRSTGTRGPGL